MSIINSKNVFANINNNFNLLSPLVTKVTNSSSILSSASCRKNQQK